MQPFIYMIKFSIHLFFPTKSVIYKVRSYTFKKNLAGSLIGKSLTLTIWNDGKADSSVYFTVKKT